MIDGIYPANSEQGVPAEGIDFFRHDLGEAELDAVREVLNGPILTTGEQVARFERRFADYLSRKHSVGVTSCTGALHLSLAALGVGPGDEVITTALTFIATATAILQAGATPVLADVEADTGNLDAGAVKAAITPRTRAIIPVHLYGQMCDMKALQAIASAHDLKLIEDAAHCVEGRRDGVRPGELSDTACFSFYATKALTSGEGGAVVTDDDGLAERLRLMRSHGMNKTANDRFQEGYKHWDMPIFGWKYNMDNISAALLLPQLDRINANHAKRLALAEAYVRELSDIKQLSIPARRPDVRHAAHLFTIQVDPADRDPLLDHLRSRRISAMVNYRAIHLMQYFRAHLGFEPGMFPVAERIGDSTLSLPFYPNMPIQQVGAVAAAVREYFGK